MSEVNNATEAQVNEAAVEGTEVQGAVASEQATEDTAGFRRGELQIISAETDASKSQLADAVTEPVSGDTNEASLASVLEETTADAPVAEEVAQPKAQEPAPAKAPSIGGPLEVISGIYGLEALKELGFSEAWLNTDNRRVVVFGTDEGLPVFNEQFKGPIRQIELWAPVTGVTVIANEDRSLMVSVLHTTARLHYLFKKGKRVWSFYIDKVEADDAAGAVNQLLQSNLQRGEEIYQDTSKLIDGFWAELLKAVYKEPTVIKLKLSTHPQNEAKNVVLPLGVKFNPENVNDVTLSVGGFCYDYRLGEWPAAALQKGAKQYINDKSRQDKSKGSSIIRGNTPRLKKRQDKAVRVSAIQQMKSETAPVLAYGKAPTPQPIPVAKSDEQRALDRQARLAAQGETAE